MALAASNAAEKAPGTPAPGQSAANGASAPAASPDRQAEPAQTVEDDSRSFSSSDGDTPPPPGEEAEAAFLAEARERGEEPASIGASLAANEEAENRSPLPPLDELVDKIPPEVRETLDDLFRGRFVRAIRIHKKSLGS